MRLPAKPQQSTRAAFQLGFFLLFVLAPPLDLFRFDLDLNHFILLGMPWTLGIDAFIAGEITATEAALNLIIRGFLPLVLVAGGLIWIAWRFGRLYCGWLCPHFSVVETINKLMLRASGKPSIWERKPLPERQANGSRVTPRSRYWPLTVLAALFFALLWSVTLLTYLLPPFEIYHNLLHGALTPNQARFIGIGTLLLFIEFIFARHLFCRFGCAVGLFQSLAWMANDRAMVVGFERSRALRCSAATMPAIMSARCGLKPRPSNAACSPAPNAPSASRPVNRCRRRTGSAVCWSGWSMSAPLPWRPAVRAKIMTSSAN